MFALPFVFVIFIVNFQAGLIVYWITTNVWTIGQQLLVRKLYPKPEPLDPRDALPEQKPARGKPAPAVAAAATGSGGDGKPSGAGGKSSGAGGKSSGAGGGNGAPAKAPPRSPRKKKKRSGRRR
jgi:YidC/Oxa1 family membrane protein insertase